MPSRQLLHGALLYVVESPIACLRSGLLQLLVFYILRSFSSFISVYGPVTAAAPALLPSLSQAAAFPPWPPPLSFATCRHPQRFASLSETSPLPRLKAVKPCERPVGVFLSSTHAEFGALPRSRGPAQGARSSPRVGATGEGQVTAGTPARPSASPPPPPLPRRSSKGLCAAALRRRGGSSEAVAEAGGSSEAAAARVALP